MSADATISVIVPTYGRDVLLAQALESLLTQTRPVDEIIVVDDGSDAALPALVTSTPNIRLFRQPHAGRSAARNTGLDVATGDFIAFLDDDDILPPESIERRARYLIEHPAVDVVYTDALAIDDAGAVLGPFRRVNPARPSGQVFKDILLHNLSPIHGYMFRRTCLEKTRRFDPALESAEDWDFWIRMASSYRFAYLSMPLAYYRMHAAMTSLDVREKLALNGQAVQEKAFAMPAFQALTPKEQARIYVRHAIWRIRTNSLSPAREYFRRAIQLDRRNLSAYGLLVLVTGLQTLFPNAFQSRFAQGIFRRRSFYR